MTTKRMFSNRSSWKYGVDSDRSEMISMGQTGFVTPKEPETEMMDWPSIYHCTLFCVGGSTYVERRPHSETTLKYSVLYV